MRLAVIGLIVLAAGCGGSSAAPTRPVNRVGTAQLHALLARASAAARSVGTEHMTMVETVKEGGAVVGGVTERMALDLRPVRRVMVVSASDLGGRWHPRR